MTEYRDFVKRMPELQNAKKAAGEHMRIAELIKTITSGDAFHDTVQCEKGTVENDVPFDVDDIFEILAGDHGDQVVPFIEDLIIQAAQPTKSLRLICLQSLVCDGLRSATFHHYRRLFVQVLSLS